MREFKIGKYKVCIVNRYTGGMEINERNPKYDIWYFSEELGGWVRLASCMTIAEGKEVASQILQEMEAAGTQSLPEDIE